MGEYQCGVMGMPLLIDSLQRSSMRVMRSWGRDGVSSSMKHLLSSPMARYLEEREEREGGKGGGKRCEE